MEQGQAYGFGVHVLNDILIVPVKGELDDESVVQLQREILDKVQANSVSGALIDMSAVRVIDSFIFSVLADTARMISLLGARPVFVGFQAGVASALVDLNIDLESITTALSMEDGMELLRCLMPAWKRLDEPEGEDEDAKSAHEEPENEGYFDQMAEEDMADNDS